MSSTPMIVLSAQTALTDCQNIIGSCDLSRISGQKGVTRVKLLDFGSRIKRHASIWKEFMNLFVNISHFCIFQLPLILSEGESNVVEAFNIAHTTVVEQLSDLSFIPRSFNPRLEDRKSAKSKRMSTSGSFIPVSTLFMV